MTRILTELTQDLLQAGLIQFGHFNEKPFQFSFELLPSYPDLLIHLAQAAHAKLQGTGYEEIEYFLAAPDSIPFGTALSILTHIPLVYAEPNTGSIVGAYDIGHPTVLLTSMIESLPWQEPLIAQAQKVGLEVHTILSIVDLNGRDITSPLHNVRSIVKFIDMLEQLKLSRKLPPGQIQAAMQWIMARTNHHQG